MRRLRSEDGVALMLVLWLIVVLAAVAATVVSTVRRQSDVVINLRARAQARVAAESGVVFALDELRTAFAATKGLDELVRVYPAVADRLQRLGAQPLGNTKFQVALVDLNSRIDLNHVDDATLAVFLTTFAGESDARALTDALLDWRDPDSAQRSAGAEADAYRAAGSPYLPPNRPIRRLEEVLRIRGFTDGVANEIAPYVTVWGDGRLNVNTASPRVLSAFPGIGSSGASMLMDARGSEGIRSLTSMGERLSRGGIGGVMPPLVGVPQRLLIVSRGWAEGHALTHETQVVLQLQGLAPGRAPDLFVMAWEERSR
ncbi:MAG: general secretion pathway protein GspK [Gemmatimonadales bacterium]|nr:general secretion pathway protein GspK [Gemmatimonadales bacterium]